jgi:hypothetical protein
MDTTLTYPLVFQMLAPLVVELTTKLVDSTVAVIPGSLVVPLAGAVGELVNWAQSNVTGVSWPPGASGLFSIFLNELAKDIGIKARKVPVVEPDYLQSKRGH